MVLTAISLLKKWVNGSQAMQSMRSLHPSNCNRPWSSISLGQHHRHVCNAGSWLADSQALYRTVDWEAVLDRIWLTSL